MLQEVVLSSEQDAFFKANMSENFGDIGMNIKKMVDDFQQVAKSNQKIQTIGLLLATHELKLGKLFYFPLLSVYSFLNFAACDNFSNLLNVCRGYGKVC